MKKKNDSKCLVCKKEIFTGDTHYPFCSLRCSEIDLGRWITEKYYFLDQNDENNS